MTAPAKAVVVVSHCFAASGPGAQDLNLTRVTLPTQECCDVRGSMSTATAVYNMLSFVSVCVCV